METEKYHMRAKGTWYFDKDIEAISIEEAKDRIVEEVAKSLFLNKNNDFLITFDDFDSWSE